MSRGDAVRLRNALRLLLPDCEVAAVDDGLTRGWGVRVTASLAALDTLEGKLP